MLHLALLKKADKQTDTGGNITSVAEVKIITGSFKFVHKILEHHVVGA